MAARNHTYGANARTLWDDLPQDRPQGGNWLPLDALDEEVYAGTPRLEALPSPRRRSEAEPLRKTQAHPARAARPAASAAPAPNARALQVRGMAMLAAAAFTALAAYVLITMAVEWVQVKLDDLQYGRPRTMQMDAYVGHNEVEGVPTHFIAMNLNRRVTVIELPGGDSTKATTIVGPYLFGQGEDLTPVQLDARDLNSDGRPDLIVSVKSEQLIYLNDGNAFRLMTPEERAALEQALRQSQSQPASPANPASSEGAEAGK
jgi:hypothetical protein